MQYFASRKKARLVLPEFDFWKRKLQLTAVFNGHGPRCGKLNTVIDGLMILNMSLGCSTLERLFSEKFKSVWEAGSCKVYRSVLNIKNQESCRFHSQHSDSIVLPNL